MICFVEPVQAPLGRLLSCRGVAVISPRISTVAFAPQKAFVRARAGPCAPAKAPRPSGEHAGAGSRVNLVSGGGTESPGTPGSVRFRSCDWHVSPHRSTPCSLYVGVVGVRYARPVVGTRAVRDAARRVPALACDQPCSDDRDPAATPAPISKSLEPPGWCSTSAAGRPPVDAGLALLSNPYAAGAAPPARVSAAASMGTPRCRSIRKPPEAPPRNTGTGFSPDQVGKRLEPSARAMTLNVPVTVAPGAHAALTLANRRLTPSDEHKPHELRKRASGGFDLVGCWL